MQAVPWQYAFHLNRLSQITRILFIISALTFLTLLYSSKHINLTLDLYVSNSSIIPKLHLDWYNASYRFYGAYNYFPNIFSSWLITRSSNWGVIIEISYNKNRYLNSKIFLMPHFGPLQVQDNSFLPALRYIQCLGKLQKCLKMYF